MEDNVILNHMHHRLISGRSVDPQHLGQANTLELPTKCGGVQQRTPKSIERHENQGQPRIKYDAKTRELKGIAQKDRNTKGMRRRNQHIVLRPNNMQ
jgi:hypothetical protein